MRFMDDLTNIYFSTRNSLRLTIENGIYHKFKKKKEIEMIFYIKYLLFQMDH